VLSRRRKQFSKTGVRAEKAFGASQRFLGYGDTKKKERWIESTLQPTSNKEVWGENIIWILIKVIESLPREDRLGEGSNNLAKRKSELRSI